MKRLLHFCEALAMAAAIGLGAVWPSLYTLIGIAVLPGFFLALAAVVQPRWLEGRGTKRWLRSYLHGGAAISALALTLQAGWMLFSHSTPVDIIVETDMTGPTLVIYDVPDGEPPQEVEGRRVLSIPRSRVLSTQFDSNDGWWLQGERRFFSRDHSGRLRPISGRVGASGTTSWAGCSARFEKFIIEPTVEVPIDLYERLDDPDSWGVRCVEGRLTSRSSGRGLSLRETPTEK